MLSFTGSLKVYLALEPCDMKKNWMFVGRADTGKRSAIIYSVLESCRRQGINPYEYLADVLERLPSSTTADIKKLTPAGWAAERRSGIARAA